MELWTVVIGAAFYFSLLVWMGKTNAKSIEAFPPAPTGEPPPSSAVILQQQRHNPWATLARAQGWPVECRELDPRRSRLNIRWGSQKDSLHIRILLTHSKELAIGTPSFGIPCRRPAKGLLNNRRLISQAMAWQDLESERTPSGKWLTKLPGPQELTWEPKNQLGSPEGMLHLSLPSDTGHLSEIRSGLRALKTALREAQVPAWAGLAHERGWHLAFDATKTLPILAGKQDGVAFRATLRKHKSGFQTHIASIAVPEQMPELRVVHKEHGEGPAADLNHPIAGGMLHASSPHSTALKLLINNPDVFGALMAVVHAHPGSSLSRHRIDLIAERDLKLELLTAIRAVATLSKALEAHYAPSPTSGPAD